jgi:hypothetical protein
MQRRVTARRDVLFHRFLLMKKAQESELKGFFHARRQATIGRGTWKKNHYALPRIFVTAKPFLPGAITIKPKCEKSSHWNRFPLFFCDTNHFGGSTMKTNQGIPGVFFPANALMKDLRTVKQNPPEPQGYVNCLLDKENMENLAALREMTGCKQSVLINEIFRAYFGAFPPKETDTRKVFIVQ